MSAVKSVKLLVEGGKATPGPPIGPVLGQLKLNIAKVVEEINQKTKEFAGTRVPVILEVNPKTREYTLKIGVPPTSELLKLELRDPSKNRDLPFDKVVKVARRKFKDMDVKNLKAAVKTVLGTAISMGLTVDGRPAKEVIALLDKPDYANKLREG